LCHGLWVGFDVTIQRFSKVIVLSEVLVLGARWRHNFREIAVENCKNSQNWRKSLCAPLRIDSREIVTKFYHTGLGPRTHIICFTQVAIWHWQQLSKFAFVVKKWLGTNKFALTKSHTGSKFS